MDNIKYWIIPSYSFGPDNSVNSGHVTRAQKIRCSHPEIWNLHPETAVSQCWVLPYCQTLTGHEKTRKGSWSAEVEKSDIATHRNEDGLAPCRKKETGDKWWLFSSYKVWLYSLNFVSMRWTIFFIINVLNLNKLELDICSLQPNDSWPDNLCRF